MEKYSTHRPTQFDSPGSSMYPERAEWFVAPVSQTRDSGALENSNFASVLTQLGGESETVEVHRFGHWGPGWYEIILIDPSDTERVKAGEDIESALENYPVLDESDWSQREQDEYYQNWVNAGAYRDFTRSLSQKFHLSSRHHVEELVNDADKDVTLAFFESLIPSGEYHTGDCWPNTEYAVKNADETDVVTFVRQLRAAR